MNEGNYLTDSGKFGVISFVASCHPTESCGTNGLPLTPNSIKILGNAQKLKIIEHENLCQYLDFFRGKHERIIAVSEYYENTLQSYVTKNIVVKEDFLMSVAFQCLKGLAYLNQFHVINQNLNPSNIVLMKYDTVKLFNYGMNEMTNGGLWVSFPFSNVRFTAPEVFASDLVCKKKTRIGEADELDGRHCFGNGNDVPNYRVGPKCDVWSLGMVLLSVSLGFELWPNTKPAQIIRKVLSFVHSDGNMIVRTAREHDALDQVDRLAGDAKTLVNACLTVSVKERSTPAELLRADMFGNKDFFAHGVEKKVVDVFPTMKLRSLTCDSGKKATNSKSGVNQLSLLSMKEIYYLWCLAGGDAKAELQRNGLLETKAQICLLPNMVCGEGETFGRKTQKSSLLDTTVTILPFTQYLARLSHIKFFEFFPLIKEREPMASKDSSNSKQSLPTFLDTEKLPLVIREDDVEYQLKRVLLYRTLLRGYPYTRPNIWREARIDVTPLYRGHIWAALLNVEIDTLASYESVDKDTRTATDRQIEVDIPRCHQYDPLLASPTAHVKFKRILKAWVVSHENYVYWQGLDSLCAPFLYLNFNDEALAYACLSAFVPKYLCNFFLKDNSLVIQEYLAKFSQLIAFHDPKLLLHLNEIGFIPDLYAIPWFLTMFSHVFPLHKIFHLWDKLLLGNSSFPLCVGLSILTQLRGTLLASGFNECILLFSDMPEIDIESCVKDSIDIFCTTPRSVTHRHFDDGGSHRATRGVAEDRLEMDYVPPAELKTEVCPRIGAADLFDLADEKKYPRAKVLIVDIRSNEEFKRGTLPRSVNIPFDGAFDSNGSLCNASDVGVLKSNAGKIICVIGNSSSNHMQEFTRRLVSLNYSRVCFLHKGVENIKSSGMLCIP